MERPTIELQIREPTGLELGTFDIFLVREKVYTGELQHRCEFKDGDGEWRPLSEHPAFSEVLWLISADTSDAAGRRVARFGGWSTKRDEDTSAEQRRPRVRIDRPGRGDGDKSRDSKGGGLLGRLFGGKK